MANKSKTMGSKGNAEVNYVHQNAILCETIQKEQKNHKLYTNYSINPFKKMYTLTGKPNSVHDSADGEEDDNFLEVIKKSNETPVKKFKFPQTSAQEVGWNTEPLIDRLWKDRLDHPIVNSEITKFMDKKWMVKEQTEINQS
ncbi:protein FAM183B-like [Stylophora pistillata]|uniref:Protein FAM183B n=1 Tax=Stylophora pistillata TaxID=50429 RepID=A0A2B4RTD5_STYPI|nr:protein FAM183B-like [Stylophora pistillata]PFX20871.1 Protein FAM183B [Stylophora pistillata]